MSEYEAGLWLWRPELPETRKLRLRTGRLLCVVAIMGVLTGGLAFTEPALPEQASAPLPALDAGKAQLFRDFEAWRQTLR